MLAGADSVGDLDIARHGGMRSLFTTVYAPSTLRSFFRRFTHGHVRQLQAAARDTLIGLTDQAPLLAGAGTLCFVDIDSAATKARTLSIMSWTIVRHNGVVPPGPGNFASAPASKRPAT